MHNNLMLLRIAQVSFTFVLLMLGLAQAYSGSPANRLVYLDGDDPFHVGLAFPKLTTQQWVGEKGVEAVVTLGIDDMRDAKIYESFCRPILDRLKQIDGHAPLSIFCNSITPGEPILQQWLKEGLSFAVKQFVDPKIGNGGTEVPPSCARD